MNLFVLRHGKAEPAGEGIRDDKRALTGKGRDEIARIAEWLLTRGEKLDLIISSPKVRAMQTAEIVGKVLKVEEDIRISVTLSSGFNTDRISREITGVPGIENVMIVGHEPDLSSFIGHVIAGENGATIKMAKGGLAKLRDFRFSDKPMGELLWLVSPDLLKEGK